MMVAMDQWLIRTAQNKIVGPYSKEQVCKLILEGQLSVQDEVCQANNYWIYLYEKDEVLKQLGIEVPLRPPRSKLESDRGAADSRKDEEITETDLLSAEGVLPGARNGPDSQNDTQNGS